MTTPKYYVRRTSDRNAAGISFVGPLSTAKADRERAAWENEGSQYAPVEIIPADAASRAFVRRWEKETRRDDAWEVVTFQGEQMTFAAYRLNHEEN